MEIKSLTLECPTQDWNFDKVCCAHNSNLIGGGSDALLGLIRYKYFQKRLLLTCVDAVSGGGAGIFGALLQGDSLIHLFFVSCIFR